jgi:hypothetical protein
MLLEARMFRSKTFFNLLLVTLLVYLLTNAYLKRDTNKCEEVEVKEDSTIEEKPPQKQRTLIMYAYFEKDSRYTKTLEYFVKLGVVESDTIDYLFIIQGKRTVVKFPKYKNVRVLRRSNGCYDFGAYGAGFIHLGGLVALKHYAFFMFINPSALGPILPKYWPSSMHWSEIFTARLKGDVHACGTSLVCEYMGPGMCVFN